MQPNTITLAVDQTNTGVTVEEPFSRYDSSGNRSTYIQGELHSPELRNMITLYRTPPTKSGNFRGTSKSSVKITQDFTVPAVDSTASVVAPVIFEGSFSIPVGVTAVDVKAIRQRMIALLDDDDFMDSLNIQLMI